MPTQIPRTGAAVRDPRPDELVRADRNHARHAGREGTDARQHHAVGCLGPAQVGGDLDARADLGQSALGRAQVARAVIDDYDRRRIRRHSTPLVDGTPLARSSIETASRSARATALNCASTM